MPYFSLCDLTALPLSSFARRTTGCSISPAVVLDLPQQKRKEKNLEKKKVRETKKNVCVNYNTQWLASALSLMFAYRLVS